MAFSYLTAKDVVDAFYDSKAHMEPLFKPFKEYRRLADNKPAQGLDPAYPRVTDGTTASIISKTPKRVVQQLPTGKVKGEGWLPIVAGFVYTDKILPHANYQFSLIQKSWAVISKGLTTGSQPGYVPFLNHDGYFCTDLSLPYIEDVYLEPGKLSDKESNFIFMRSWYQPKDIESIIDREKTLKGKAKDRGEAYDSGWNLSALAKIKDEVSSDPGQTGSGQTGTSNTPSDQRKNREGVEIIHAFQKGIGGKFYSFHAKTGKIVRTKTNKDPRGVIPLHYFYADSDLANPLGRGYVEMVASLQNLIDAEMQMYQYNRALMLNPPVMTYGIPKNKFKFVPNISIETTNPDAYIKPVEIDSTAVQRFPELYGLTKSQLLNILSSPDTSISSEVGNPGFSKTPAGVNAQQQNISVDDNFIRKQFESWFEDVSETMINLYFAERKGIDEIQLDKSTAEKLRKLTDFDQDMLSDDNMIRLNYDDETEKLKFEVDASTSNMKDDAQERDRLVELLDITEKYGLGDKGLIVERELVDRIVVKSGVEDPEKIVPDEETFNNQQQQMAMQQQAQQAQMQPPQDPNMPLQAPQEASQAPPLSEQDMAFAEQLRQEGVPDDKIGQAMAMLAHGISSDEVMQMITEGQANG